MIVQIPRCRVPSLDSVRRRALERLYERRCAVDQLIGSLERYQREQLTRRAVCVEINAAKR